MRLKKLKIFGFKSFAERISLNFDASIVAVVGPNGCGKSNIVDAFRWVMGEQSAKSMRGDKMHDVLFAGTDRRKGLNVAEVSVTLTDVEGELPIDYDEVTLTRRLYRSGESEYLINNQQVRLKDVQNLLSGSGLGKNAFSVFEQGKLDQVINLGPMERRGIFDETAGIGRFLQQKKESLRKLDQVTENFTRVTDLFTEVDKQTRTLRRQASQAKQFQEKQRRLETLEKSLLVARFVGACDKEGDLGYLEVKERVKEAQLALGAFEEQFQSERRQLAEQEKETGEKSAQLLKGQSSAKIKEAEAQRHSERIAEIGEKEKRLRYELENLGKERKKAFQKIKESERQLEERESEKREEEEKLEALRQQRRRLELESERLRGDGRRSEKARFDMASSEGKIAAQLQEKQARLEASDERLERLAGERKERKKTLQRLHKEKEEKQAKVEALSHVIDTLAEEVKVLGAKTAELELQIVSKKEVQIAFHQEWAEKQAREKALIRLREEYEGFSLGAKAMLASAQDPKSPLYGQVQGLFEALSPKSTEIPALRSYANTLIVKNLELAAQVAADNGWDELSLLSVDHVRTLLSELTVVEGLKDALSKTFVVTKAGDFIDRAHVLFRGSTGNVFAREAELKELGQELIALGTQGTEQECALQQLSAQLDEIRTSKQEAETQRQKAEMQLVEHNFALQQRRAELSKEEEAQRRLDVEEQALEEIRREGKSVLATLSRELTELQKQSAALETASAGAESALEEHLTLVNKAKEAEEAHAQLFQEVVEKWQQCRRERAIFETRDQESQKHQTRIVDELESSRALLKECAELKESLGKEVAALTEQMATWQQEVMQSQHALEQKKVRYGEMEEAVADKRRVLAELEQTRHHYEVTLAEEASVRKGIAQNLQERFGLSIEEAKAEAEPLESSLEETQEEMRDLRYALEKSGAVNLAAIEECKEQEVRRDFLGQQLDDLKTAKEDLEKIITHLEKESRKLFKTTFEQIRKNFQKNFQILFQGGQADLTFTDSPDVLAAGVEIIAKPPGKQMRAISLLSGGEKCLTALALLFSIFEVRPAPFCILDEVDAPLDDSNIDRFTQMLAQFTDRTQFIMVTHNKKTMALADILFGISMEEKGVSKLVSLQFEREEALA